MGLEVSAERGGGHVAKHLRRRLKHRTELNSDDAGTMSGQPAAPSSTPAPTSTKPVMLSTESLPMWAMPLTHDDNHDMDFGRLRYRYMENMLDELDATAAQ